MKKRMMRAQKGAISVFVMVAMVFFLVTIVGIYMVTSKRGQMQTESVKLVKDKYYTEGEENTLYEGKIASDTEIIPIYTKEQLWLIGENTGIEIDGKVYDFSTTDLSRYQLQNDIIINIESDLKNSKFKDNYVFGGSTIQKNNFEVLYYYNEEYYIPIQYSKEGSVTNLSDGAAVLSASGENFTSVSKKVTDLSENYYLFASTNPPLVEQIQASNYGDKINYSVTINGTELSDWKIFYKDAANNIYIITSEYLPSTLIPAAAGMSNDGKYSAWWESGVTNNKDAVNKLASTDYWSEFATGVNGVSATGSPTLEMWTDSWNAKGYTHLYISSNANGYFVGTSTTNLTSSYDVNLSTTTGYTDKLYFPYTGSKDWTVAYWLASPSAYNVARLMRVNYGGTVKYDNYNTIPTESKKTGLGVRPVVCLRSTTPGKKVGDTWKID